jgi:hypothetical protein
MSRNDLDLAQALALIGELDARIAALEAARAREAGIRAGQARADSARLMGAAQWAAVFGAPGPTSRPIAADAAGRQLASRAPVWRAPVDGPEVQAGAFADQAEIKRWGGS